MNAVASAKTRRNLRRGTEESGLGLLSGSSEDESGKNDNCAGAGEDRLVEMEREKKRKAKEEKKNQKKCRDEGGDKNGGELQLGGSFDKTGRKSHLWEEICLSCCHYGTRFTCWLIHIVSIFSATESSFPKSIALKSEIICSSSSRGDSKLNTVRKACVDNAVKDGLGRVYISRDSLDENGAWGMPCRGV